MGTRQRLYFQVCLLSGATGLASVSPGAQSRPAAGKAYRQHDETTAGWLPSSSELAGFKTVSLVQGTASSVEFERRADHARLRLDALKGYYPPTHDQAVQEPFGRWAKPVPSTFSGMPLGERAQSAQEPGGTRAALATQFGSVTITARLTYPAGQGSPTRSDLLLLERLTRETLSRAMAELVRKTPSRLVGLLIDEHPTAGLVACAGQHCGPVRPVLTHLGLRVEADPQVPALRGWKGKHVLITVPLASRSFQFGDTWVPFEGGGISWRHHGELCCPVADLGAVLGFGTYFRARLDPNTGLMSREDIERVRKAGGIVSVMPSYVSVEPTSPVRRGRASPPIRLPSLPQYRLP